MSGTSVDGVDAALVDFKQNKMQLIGTASCDYPQTLRSRLLKLNTNPTMTLATLAELDHLVALSFIEATTQLLYKYQTPSDQVIAVGSHGQTIFHSPNTQPATTLQIGDNSLIASRLRIDTIGDFRRADIAAGGQGAPLMPAFHQAIFGNDTLRFILNLGGIANITVLGAGPVKGFDTGPANTLLDAWIQKSQSQPFDRNGQWARSGKVDDRLLTALLSDPYFVQTPPKSTGADYFNLQWLESKLTKGADASTVQATLAELTAISVANDIVAWTQQGQVNTAEALEVLVCGGGAHNEYMIERLTLKLPDHQIRNTKEHGLDGDFAEAMGFAWLAHQYMQKQPGNLPSVTGAGAAVVLGGKYIGKLAAPK